MSEEQALSFSLKLKSVPITVELKDSTNVKYSLKELSGLDRDEFLQDMKGRTVLDKDGKEDISNFKGLQALLLKRSLYDSSDAKVSAEALDSFPSSVLTMLYKEAQKLSGMVEDAESTLTDELIEAAKEMTDSEDSIAAVIACAKKLGGLEDSAKND